VTIQRAHLHIDGTCGAAGDMLLGALIDLGVPRAVIDEAIGKLGVEAERLVVAEVVKHGIRATDVKVDAGGGHGHGHHPHVAMREIEGRIRSAGLPARVEALAMAIFSRVAIAEGRIHGKGPGNVHLHEVGALDSIVDIVGAAAALAWLEPTSVSATAVAMGHGTIRGSHGVLPVPSPAALAILRDAGGLIEDGGVARELCTPTGAAILAEVVTAWGPMPAMVPLAVGYGAGDADLADRANVVRATVGRVGRPRSEHVYRIEANVDDMSPEICEHVADCLTAAGAVDVWWTPVVMKKSRPGFVMSALAPEGALDAVIRAALLETTSIGLRFDRVARRVLDREAAAVDTVYGSIEIKLASLDGEVVNAAPEYESCRAAAAKHGVPLKRIYAAAIAAWETR